MRRLASAGLAGVMSLLLMGAAAGSGSQPTGTASTSLSGVDLTVSGAVPGDVSLVDLTTIATTDPSGTPAGPLAQIALVPLTSGGESVGAVEVSSDGDGEATSAPAALPAGAPIGAGVDAVKLSASASADRAAAVVGATTASLSALTDAVGIDLDLDAVESVVTATKSTASQGVGVSGFDLSLGDLLPLDVLSVLPLDVLLDLASLLPVGIPNLETLITDLLDLEVTVQTVVTSLEDAVADLDGALDDLGNLEDAADAVDDAEQALADLGLSADLIAGIVEDPVAGVEAIVSDPDAVSGIGGGLTADTDGSGSGGGLTDTVGGIVSGGSGGSGGSGDSGGDGGVGDVVDDVLPGLAVQDVSAAATTQLEDAITDLAQAVTDQDTLQNTVGTITTVTQTITETVSTITSLVDQLESLLPDVVSLLNQLEGLLPDLLAALEEGEILSVGPLDVGMTTVAASTIEDSSASVSCGATTISIVGQSLSAPDCTSPLEGLSGTLQSALGIVSDVLGSLPVDTGLTIPDVELSLFPQVTESVTEKDGTVTSTAGVTLFELSLPSVTLDPAAVVDGVLSSLLDDLVATLTAQLPTTAELAGLDLSTTLEESLNVVLTEVPSLSGLTDQVLAAVGELPLGVDVPTLATPGLEMSMASAANSSFTPGSTAGAPGDPTLPATGGGMAAIGLLALLVGTGLRRRSV